MANREGAGAVRSEKRRRQSGSGLDEEANEVRGDKEDKQRPQLEELRKFQARLHIGRMTKRRAKSSLKMGAASISRSVLSSSKPSSRHGRKKTHGHRSEGDAKQRRKRKSSSRALDSTQEYVYGSPGYRVRPSTVKSSVNRPSRQKGNSEERAQTMSAISEEADRKERKVNIIYIKSERPKPSKHSLHKVANENEKTSKASVRSIHHSSTTSSRKSATISPLGIPKRYESLVHPIIYIIAK
jgi:hypothetical protein